MSEYRKIRGNRHYVFDNVEEFVEFYDSKMMSPPDVVKNWREAKEGDWVFSDDTRIIRLLKVA